jgi:hypothetical protein
MKPIILTDEEAEIFAIQWKNESKCDSEFCFSSRIEAEAYLARKSSEYQGIVVPLYRYQAPQSIRKNKG